MNYYICKKPLKKVFMTLKKKKQYFHLVLHCNFRSVMPPCFISFCNAGQPADNSIWHELIKVHLYATWAMTGPKIAHASCSSHLSISRSPLEPLETPILPIYSTTIQIQDTPHSKLIARCPACWQVVVAGEWFTGSLETQQQHQHQHQVACQKPKPAKRK